MKTTQQVEEFVTMLGGKSIGKLPYWNAFDEDKNIEYRRFQIPYKDGYILVETACLKEGCSEPVYGSITGPACGNFSASLNTIPITPGFVPVTEDNLIKYLGEFN